MLNPKQRAMLFAKMQDKGISPRSQNIPPMPTMPIAKSLPMLPPAPMQAPQQPMPFSQPRQPAAPSLMPPTISPVKAPQMSEKPRFAKVKKMMGKK